MIEPRIPYVASADGTQIAYTTIGEGLPLVIPANASGGSPVRSPTFARQ
jgi:hypothetical protein